MQVKDPVCGMTVDSLTASARRVHVGKTYFFCAPGCAERFEKEPGRYLKKEDTAKAASPPSSARASTFAKASEDRSEANPRRKPPALFEIPSPKPQTHPPAPVQLPKSKIQNPKSAVTLAVEGMHCASCV